MLYRVRSTRRRGASTSELAVVLPVVLLVILALMVGGMGVFKYHEVAHAARETARFASVHGAEYAKANAVAIQAGTLPTVDKAYLISLAKKSSFTLDPNQMQVSVQMMVLTPGATSATSLTTVDWDDTTNNQNRSPYSAWTNNATTPATNVEVANVLIVQVTYSWSPNLLGVSPMNLTSTAVVPMSF
jgi:hypothetical protein